jgi:hypothetical protein
MTSKLVQNALVLMNKKEDDLKQSYETYKQTKKDRSEYDSSPYLFSSLVSHLNAPHFVFEETMCWTILLLSFSLAFDRAHPLTPSYSPTLASVCFVYPSFVNPPSSRSSLCFASDPSCSCICVGLGKLRWHEGDPPYVLQIRSPSSAAGLQIRCRQVSSSPM